MLWFAELPTESVPTFAVLTHRHDPSRCATTSSTKEPSVCRQIVDLTRCARTWPLWPARQGSIDTRIRVAVGRITYPYQGVAAP